VVKSKIQRRSHRTRFRIPRIQRILMKTQRIGNLNTVKKILAPTDLSENSRWGVHYALIVGRELDAAVTIYYVVTGNDIAGFRRRRTKEAVVAADFNDFMKAYEIRLRSFVEQNFAEIPSVKVTQKVEFGTPEKSIVETAKTEEVDWIIMATRGMRRGLSRIFLGSVTEEVIRNAPCPVVAIPPGSSHREGISIRQRA
jgi:nucleotide-binding universal stress UspA family protein